MPIGAIEANIRCGESPTFLETAGATTNAGWTSSKTRSRKMKQVLLGPASAARGEVAERQSGHEDALRATSRVSLVSLRRSFVTYHPLNTPAARMLFRRDSVLGPIPQRTI